MDGRPGKGLRVVQPSHFTADQRRRLEAVTAAIGLLTPQYGEGRGVTPVLDEILRLAAYIETGD